MGDKIDLIQHLREGKLKEGFYISRDRNYPESIFYLFNKDGNWHVQFYWNQEFPIAINNFSSFFAEKTDDPVQAIKEKERELRKGERFVESKLAELVEKAKAERARQKPEGLVKSLGGHPPPRTLHR